MIQHLKSPFSRSSKAHGKTESSGDENLVLVTEIPEIQVLGTLLSQSQRTPHLQSTQAQCPCVGHPERALTVRVGRTEIPKHGCLEIAWDLGVWGKSSIQRLSIASLYEGDLGAPGHCGDLHVKLRVEITGQSG